MPEDRTLPLPLPAEFAAGLARACDAGAGSDRADVQVEDLTLEISYNATRPRQGAFELVCPATGDAFSCPLSGGLDAVLEMEFPCVRPDGSTLTIQPTVRERTVVLDDAVAADVDALTDGSRTADQREGDSLHTATAKFGQGFEIDVHLVQGSEGGVWVNAVGFVDGCDTGCLEPGDDFIDAHEIDGRTLKVVRAADLRAADTEAPAVMPQASRRRRKPAVPEPRSGAWLRGRARAA